MRETPRPSSPRKLHRRRTWPGAVGAVLTAAGFSVQVMLPDLAVPALIAVMAGAITVVASWLFFSRARWPERLGGMVLLVAVWVALQPLLDPSIVGGAMGALPVLAFPVLLAAFGGASWATRNLPTRVRFSLTALAVVAAAGFCGLVRTAGVGPGVFEFRWRWTPTPEERLLAGEGSVPAAIPPVADSPPRAPAIEPGVTPAPIDARPPTASAPPAWPGFRGPGRDGVVHGIRIETDWSEFPPRQLWRRAIGPGWSSFAVDDGRIYTQEQRGEQEIVASYSFSTGEPVWMHGDATRFWESNGGAGPRATPTLDKGRVYAFGATGLLNALDAQSGARIWQRNAASDIDMPVPDWGFASSPLVVDDTVIVAAGGELVGYDSESGQLRWVGPDGGFSYSSPHRLTIDGVDQVVLLSASGATGVAPAAGRLLWRYSWEGGAIVQPALVGDGDIVINAIGLTGGLGLRRLSVTREGGEWGIEERWTSRGLKPYFNDFVIHEGHAYGFDGSIMSSIDLSDGSRNWKGGRYGSGQLLLLADQGVLLVVCEDGDLALVEATPDAFNEIARVAGMEGKTWNHPVLVDDVLIVRNGEEMAAFRLTVVK